ncbi:MAG: hypothetical protein WC828_02205 [Thermoleophilia bacterium]|jgi:hypothetical protein
MYGSVQLTPWLPNVGSIFGFLLFLFIVFKLIGVRVIRCDQVGIVEKWWSTKGSLEGRIIALNGEAGYQPEKAVKKISVWISISRFLKFLSLQKPDLSQIRVCSVI